MKRSGVVAVTLLAAVPAVAHAVPAPAATPRGDLVDTRIGTEEGSPDFGTGGGAGSTYPGPVAPFGMVQPSPDTDPSIGNFGGLYTYSDRKLRGFSLTHVSGGGCAGLGDVPILPTTARVDTAPTQPASFDLKPQYLASFSHEGEVARPGDYRVTLGDGTAAELTATTRTAALRFAFPTGRDGSILVNGGGSAMGNFASDVRVDPARREITGTIAGGQYCANRNRYRLHYVVRFDRPISASGTWVRQELEPGATEAGDRSDRGQTNVLTLQYRRIPFGPDALPGNPSSGAQAGAYATFAQGGTVTARAAISLVSVEGARRNLDAEAPDATSFDALRDAARARWEDELGRVAVQGGTDAQRRVFTTALYHALVMPNVVSDVDGRYQGMDDRVHRVADGHVQLANVSGWDVYRSEVPLLAMLHPEVASDLVRSLVAGWRESGHLPKWQVLNGQTNIMVGDPADAIIAGARAFGARDLDADEALRAMLDGATRDTGPAENAGYVHRPGLADLLRLGYVGHERNTTATGHTVDPSQVWGSAATTLEYGTADAAIARFAAATGRDDVCRAFAPRSAAWTRLWDPQKRLIRPRYASGGWATDDGPSSDTGFVEGSEAQYVWGVPYDVGGLVQRMGGTAAARRRLDTFFTELNAGASSPYAFLGNEPNLHVPSLYDWVGDPAAGARVTRRAMLGLYRPTPGGYPGNDDAGTMASWWVLNALGVYPTVPGVGLLALGAPLFPHAEVRLGGGGRLVVDAPGAADDATTVEGVSVDGVVHRRTWLAWDDIRRGARLRVALSRADRAAWGTGPDAAPPSFPPDRICGAVPSALAGEAGRLRLAVRRLPGGRTRVRLAGPDLAEVARARVLGPARRTLPLTRAVTVKQRSRRVRVRVVLRDGGHRVLRARA